MGSRQSLNDSECCIRNQNVTPRGENVPTFLEDICAHSHVEGSFLGVAKCGILCRAKAELDISRHRQSLEPPSHWLACRGRQRHPMLVFRSGETERGIFENCGNYDVVVPAASELRFLGLQVRLQFVPIARRKRVEKIELAGIVEPLAAVDRDAVAVDVCAVRR